MREECVVLIGSILALMFLGRKKLVHNPARAAPNDVVDFYKRFQWGNNPNKAIYVGKKKYPAWIAKLGDLKAVVYESEKGGKKQDYIHYFKRPLPSLASSKNGRELFVVGGEFNVNWRGIVG